MTSGELLLVGLEVVVMPAAVAEFVCHDCTCKEGANFPETRTDQNIAPLPFDAGSVNRRMLICFVRDGGGADCVPSHEIRFQVNGVEHTQTYMFPPSPNIRRRLSLQFNLLRHHATKKFFSQYHERCIAFSHQEVTPPCFFTS